MGSKPGFVALAVAISELGSLPGSWGDSGLVAGISEFLVLFGEFPVGHLVHLGILLSRSSRNLFM